MSNVAFFKTGRPRLHNVATKAGKLMASLAELDALFTTLQHRAFHAEL
jgi:hypothetical protein